MKKIIIFLLILIVTASCSKLYIPVDDDFKLSYIVSNQTPKIGDEIEVSATLENLSNSDFNFDGDSLHITIVNIDDPNSLDAFAGTGLLMNFKAHQKHSETRKFLIEKPGKYSISAISRFVIKNTAKIPASTFELKTDPTIFEVAK
jgi:hypothetical protein